MRGVAGFVALAGALFALAAPAAAAPPCPLQPQATTLVDLGLTLESIIAGPDGKLYFTDTDRDRLMVLDRPRATPRVLVDDIDSPGGLAFDSDGSLLVGYGNSIPAGLIGNLLPMAGVMRVNTETGEHEVVVEGLSMANGLAIGPDGAIYASDDVGLGIDRVVGGSVELRWAIVVSSNGLVIDRAGENLYAAQTFQPAAIVKVPLDNPAAASVYARPPLGDLTSGPDGLIRDGIDRLYVAVNSGGQIWRVNRRREICTLATSPPLGPSALTFGHGRGGPFPRRNLYFVTFQGELVELPGVLRGKARSR